LYSQIFGQIGMNKINNDATFQQLVLYEYIEAGLFCLTFALIPHNTNFEN